MKREEQIPVPRPLPPKERNEVPEKMARQLCSGAKGINRNHSEMNSVRRTQKAENQGEKRRCKSGGEEKLQKGASQEEGAGKRNRRSVKGEGTMGNQEAGSNKSRRRGEGTTRTERQAGAANECEQRAESIGARDVKRRTGTTNRAKRRATLLSRAAGRGPQKANPGGANSEAERRGKVRARPSKHRGSTTKGKPATSRSIGK